MDEKPSISECSINIAAKTNLDMDSCRICSRQDDGIIGMTNIFESNELITEKILFCTGIQFRKEDGLPMTMCGSCLDDLSVAHRFKTSCITIAEMLQSTTKSDLKIEEDDDGSNAFENCHDNVSMKLESDIVIEEHEVIPKNIADVSIKECVEPKVRKKRGSAKKNGKLKATKKAEEPEVKEEVKEEADLDKINAKYSKRLRCEPCGLTFESRQLADEHRETAHKGETQAWVCEICGQKFTHRGSLSTHTRSHFPPTFACPQCSYRASHKYDLTKHQRIHAGERPFQCDMCPASFYDASNMNSHIRRNHQRLMNFRCDVCGRGFYDRSKLNRHVDSHNNIKRHSCAQCGRAFTRLSYLKTHAHSAHNLRLPPRRPGPRPKNLLVDVPQVEYVKPTLIAVKQDTPT